MKIGIIGTGNMGRSIGIVWQRLGHEVLFGRATHKKRPSPRHSPLVLGAAAMTRRQALATCYSTLRAMFWHAKY
jgi:predicted dinucleotide-binding enzyme